VSYDPRLTVAGAVTLVVLKELERAIRKFPRELASLHESLGVLVSEFAELQEAITKHEGDIAIEVEAVQVACSAIRLIVEHRRRPKKEKKPGNGRA